MNTEDAYDTVRVYEGSALVEEKLLIQLAGGRACDQFGGCVIMVKDEVATVIFTSDSIDGRNPSTLDGWNATVTAVVPTPAPTRRPTGFATIFFRALPTNFPGAAAK